MRKIWIGTHVVLEIQNQELQITQKGVFYKYDFSSAIALESSSCNRLCYKIKGREKDLTETTNINWGKVKKEQ